MRLWIFLKNIFKGNNRNEEKDNIKQDKWQAIVDNTKENGKDINKRDKKKNLTRDA